MTKNGKFQGATEQSLLDIKGILARIEDRMDKHSTRISNLEKWRWLLTGGIAVLAATRWPEIGQLIAFGGR